MFLTTLCYIEKDDCYLMLHRVKKENDLNHDKWIGVGGKFEAGEMPEECMLREVKEETGLTLTSYRARGVITFISNEWGTEYMHLFTSDQFTGEMADCDEGELVWVSKKKIKDLKDRPLLLFVNDWSIRMVLERNEGLELSEFGRS